MIRCVFLFFAYSASGSHPVGCHPSFLRFFSLDDSDPLPCSTRHCLYYGLSYLLFSSSLIERHRAPNSRACATGEPVYSWRCFWTKTM